jgi:hypothetical protein
MKSQELKIYDFIIDNNIATESETDLCTFVSGWNVETLNTIIYARTGYHDAEQCITSEPDAFTDIHGDFQTDEEDESEE